MAMLSADWRCRKAILAAHWTPQQISLVGRPGRYQDIVQHVRADVIAVLFSSRVPSKPLELQLELVGKVQCT